MEEKKLEMLYKAIEDSQQTIRFLDTKASFSVVFIGIFAAMLGAGLPEFSKYFWNMCAHLQICFIAVLLIFIATIIFAVITAIRSVYPKSNPIVHIDGNVQALGLFYIDGATNPNGKLKVSSNELKTKVDSVTTIASLIDELIIEVLKLAYIRECKLRYVQVIKKCIVLLIFVSLFLMFLHFLGESCYIPSGKVASTTSCSPLRFASLSSCRRR
jgi:hypothetical protein